MILWAIAHPATAATVVGLLVAVFGLVVARLAYDEGRAHKDDSMAEAYRQGWLAHKREQEQLLRTRNGRTAGKASW